VLLCRELRLVVERFGGRNDDQHTSVLPADGGATSPNSVDVACALGMTSAGHEVLLAPVVVRRPDQRSGHRSRRAISYRLLQSRIADRGEETSAFSRRSDRPAQECRCRVVAGWWFRRRWFRRHRQRRRRPRSTPPGRGSRGAACVARVDGAPIRFRYRFVSGRTRVPRSG